MLEMNENRQKNSEKDLISTFSFIKKENILV